MGSRTELRMAGSHRNAAWVWHHEGRKPTMKKGKGRGYLSCGGRVDHIFREGGGGHPMGCLPRMEAFFELLVNMRRHLQGLSGRASRTFEASRY